MDEKENASPRRSQVPAIVGVLGATFLGAAGFFVANSGKISSVREVAGRENSVVHGETGHSVRFVELQPLLVSINRASPPRQLRFEAQLEVASAYEDEVAENLPRIMDVMNSYIRAIEMSDLQQPASLVKLRSQLLRRIQVISGEGRVRDLLVMKFLIS